ncbi:EAL domain-containing protein [Actinomycetospora termitidis]|uniref:EAL domain-containing protein n=1 Tax=Actinomycetospora termitidis TaxID=3053470 RepID=A0ABT7M8E3_9PSEU|nr:EAL domain-containing protein [Actinomycetospora sp. Odt1-22]MDL5156935.1 EAL domain-containing protein [Actinomycetospora sp. Odt1-22]
MTEVPGVTGVADPASAELTAAMDGLTTVFQPIVDLATGGVIAHEALTRGPAGVLARPEQLFDRARSEGRLAELDELCRIRALEATVAAGDDGPSTLFLNVEPDGIPVGEPPPVAREFARHGGRLVMEFTERALTADPARVQWFANRLRHVGIAIALDDVGSHPGSLALMPFLRPEVVKLDQRLVQGPHDDDAARIATAVSAYAEQNDAIVLAEGIETAEHERTARAFGATLGQGWFYGRPGRLGPDPRRVPPVSAPLARAPEGPTRRSPFATVSRSRPMRHGGLDEVSLAAELLERRALTAEGPTVTLATVGPGGVPTDDRADRYVAAARDTSLVALLGAGREPLPGVRGADLGEGDPLRSEWDVVVVGPHVAAALVARETVGGEYQYAVVYDRDLVLELARSLMSRTVPAPNAAMPGA